MTDVVFVSHEANRTGAPIVLLNLIDRVRATTDLDVAVVLRDGGDLESDFAARGARHALPGAVGAVARRVASALDRAGRPRGARRLRRLSMAVALRAVRGAPLLYANTIVSAEYLDLVPPGMRVLLHVHELAYTTGRAVDPRDLPNVARADVVVVLSRAVADFVESELGVPAERIVVCPPLLSPAPCVVDRATARRRLGLPLDRPVVGMVGLPHWRKGPDLFASLAADVVERVPAVLFAWVGAPPGSDGARWLAHDIGARGIGSHVVVVPPVASMAAHMQAFDVLALTSREEPYGLVALEAAAAGVAVTSFVTAGAAELLDDVPWCAAPDGDVAFMADAVVRLLADDETRRRVGERLRERVQRDHDPHRRADALAACVRREVERARAGNGGAWRGAAGLRSSP